VYVRCACVCWMSCALARGRACVCMNTWAWCRPAAGWVKNEHAALRPMIDRLRACALYPLFQNAWVNHAPRTWILSFLYYMYREIIIIIFPCPRVVKLLYNASCRTNFRAGHSWLWLARIVHRDCRSYTNPVTGHNHYTDSIQYNITPRFPSDSMGN